MLFSEKTQAFYDETLEYGSLPTDVITIDATVWLDTLDKINQGFFAMIEGTDITLSDTVKPSPYYSFNKDTLKWTQSAEQIKAEQKIKNKANLNKAQEQYESVSKTIQDYVDRLQDQDFEELSEEELKAAKSSLTDYRKKLRSYISTGDGSIDPPILTDVIGG